MTLQQLRYVIMVAETGTITEAASRLFISQPSLTNAIHELEKEMNIKIFDRTNKGIHISKDGEDFLGYARQVLEQATLLEERYKGGNGGKQEFCVSTQHYSFAVNAFVDLIKKYGHDEYDFSIRETQTYEIIEDVATMKSEIGVIYMNDFNRVVLEKEIKSHNLVFNELMQAEPHVFISRKHPLAGRSKVTIGLNGFTVCSGVIDEELNGKDIIAVPLDGEGGMHIGYVTHKNVSLSRLGEIYVEALKRYIM